MYLVPLQAAVETQRKYKHVLWYSLFVAAYLIVLYLQASAYNSGEVVSTLRNQLMPGEPPQLCCICLHSSGLGPSGQALCCREIILAVLRFVKRPQQCRPVSMLQRGLLWPQWLP